VFCVAGLFGSYVYAVKLGGAAMASVLLYTAPAWVALMSFFLLKERMGPFKIAAVCATIAGVAGISLGPRLAGDVAGGVPVTAASVLVGLLAGFTTPCTIFSAKLYLSRYKTPTIFFYALPMARAALPFFELRAPSIPGLAACGFLALCSTYGAIPLYYAGLKPWEATRAAVVATIEPVVAAVWPGYVRGGVFRRWVRRKRPDPLVCFWPSGGRPAAPDRPGLASSQKAVIPASPVRISLRKIPPHLTIRPRAKERPPPRPIRRFKRSRVLQHTTERPEDRP
jgi:hypothetical protein